MQTREQFREEAKSVVVVIDGVAHTLQPHEFRTDSLGWKLNAKQQVQGVRCQIGLNITVIGSKEME
jgi:hypothetical protein